MVTREEQEAALRRSRQAPCEICSGDHFGHTEVSVCYNDLEQEK